MAASNASPNSADTQKRASYVATVTQSTSMFAEYDYVAGDCLLRLSNHLTPKQAKKVASTFSKVMGVPAVAATPAASPSP